MRETKAVFVSPEFLALFGCLVLVWLALAFATHFAHARLRVGAFLKYWSLAWFCASIQLGCLLTIHCLDGSYRSLASQILLFPAQIAGFLQPSYIALAAYSTNRTPSRRVQSLFHACSFVFALLVLASAFRMHFANESDVLQFLVTPKLFLMAAVNAWFGFAYSRLAPSGSTSHFRFAIPIPCGLQATHAFLVGCNHASGGAFYFSANSYPAALIGVALSIALLLGLLFDLTEEARRNNDAKSAFLSNMTHELRTPLAGLIGLSSILSSSRLEGEQKDITNSIGQCASSVLSLVDDILDVSRIEAGRTTVQPVVFSPRSLVDEVVSMLSLNAANKGVLLEASYSPLLSDFISTDAALLKRILLNLIGNALKFTDSGTVLIHVSPEPYGDVPRLRFTVSDTGCGIPAADLPQLTQHFYQASNAVSASTRGTGLGLFLSQSWVRLLGGSGLEIQSQLGQGSSFSFAILAPKAIPVSTETNLSPSQSTMPSLNVLVAEDNKVNQLVLVRLLEKLGHRAIVATDGLDAVEQWQSHHPDMILMDFRMPGLDGPAAARKIRDLERGTSHTPIIAVTANAMVEDREVCLAAGMDSYLTKPVTLQKLDAAIRQLHPMIQNCST
jgi:signal transduction histidine kinase/CheY-like chemotaxis protein